MKLPIKVTYPKGSFGSEDTHHYQFEVEVPGILEYPQNISDTEILDIVYRMINRVDGSPIEHLIEQFECRSMSVGDIVTIGNNRTPGNNRTYRCAMAGWEKVS